MTTYDHWKTTNPADEWLGPYPDEPEWEPEFQPVECADLVPLIPRLTQGLTENADA